MRAAMSFGKAFAALAVALVISACGQNNQAKAPESGEAAAVDVSKFRAEAFRGGAVEIVGNVVTARRDGDGAQGVTIHPAARATTPVLLSFTVQGDRTRLRVRQNGVLGYVALQANNALMLGPGGANEIVVFSPRAEEIVLTVTGADDCSATVTCAPATFLPPEE